MPDISVPDAHGVSALICTYGNRLKPAETDLTLSAKQKTKQKNDRNIFRVGSQNLHAHRILRNIDHFAGFAEKPTEEPIALSVRLQVRFFAVYRYLYRKKTRQKPTNVISTKKRKTYRDMLVFGSQHWLLWVSVRQYHMLPVEYIITGDKSRYGYCPDNLLITLECFVLFYTLYY